MVALLKRQEQDRKDLAAGVFDAWQSVKENEKKLLAPYDGEQEHAPKEVKKAIIQGREAYFEEWGSDGRLAAVMSERHTIEREALVRRTQIREEIQQRRDRNKDRER